MKAKPKGPAGPPPPKRGQKVGRFCLTKALLTEGMFTFDFLIIQKKLKKIKEKYKDQDEEEKELRMQILGVS